MSDDKPRRAQTHGDAARVRRRNDSAGAPAHAIDDDKTPPPARLPILPAVGRTPTPDEVRRLETKVNELVDATARTWGARDVDKRLDRMQDDLADNTRSTIRMEALLDGLLGPLVKEQQAKLDMCMHHIAASSHQATAIISLGSKLDTVADRLSSIEVVQRAAAERFDAHDARDREFYALASHQGQRISALEQRQTVTDATAKIRRMASRRAWWFSAKGVGVVAAALAAAVATVIAAASAMSPPPSQAIPSFIIPKPKELP